ncbi:MAG TPA: hypothetical protein QF861_11155, partial [Alphaproteobacteria bacterium]|nr:hypothetical protein [Alphaproteobacteria bacterium]
DLKNVLREINSDRGNFGHRTAPSWRLTATALWHIVMPVAGAVHSINSRKQLDAVPQEPCCPLARLARDLIETSGLN